METKKIENVSMAGKRVIITGPTSGFGKEIAVQLALSSAEIVLPAVMSSLREHGG